jgi:hypothetical protein
MKKSEFKEWFKAQYGGRFPDANKRRRLSIKIHELESQLIVARSEFRLQEWLADTCDAALKGWNASPSAAGDRDK